MGRERGRWEKVGGLVLAWLFMTTPLRLRNMPRSNKLGSEINCTATCAGGRLIEPSHERSTESHAASYVNSVLHESSLTKVFITIRVELTFEGK